MKNRFKKIAAFLTVLVLSLSASVPVFAEEPTFGEKMAAAGRNTLIGLCVVFVILLALSLIISLFKFIPHGKKVEKKPTPVFVNKTEAPSADDEELIAVIMAAIAASEGEGYDPTHYRLKSIKRVKTTRRWNRARG